MSEHIQTGEFVWAASVQAGKVTTHRCTVLNSGPTAFDVEESTSEGPYQTRLLHSEFEVGTAQSVGTCYGRCPDETLVYLLDALCRDRKRILERLNAVKTDIDAVRAELKESD